MRATALGAVSLLSAIAMLVAGATTASAAVTVGETPAATAFCGGDLTFVQATPLDQYVVPSAGVITSWSHRASTSPPALKLKVARGTSPNYTIVGEAPATGPLQAEALNTFPARIAVQAGDRLGLYVPEDYNCSVVAAIGAIRYDIGDLQGGPHNLGFGSSSIS